MQTTRPAPRPFFSYRSLFQELAAPSLAELAGDFEASLLGPPWFQAVSRFGLGLGGMPGWYGKRFDAQGKGINLLQRNGTLEPVVPMEVRVEPSKLDGKPAAVVHYPASSQFPWHYVLDELRAWEGGTLLGMTFLDLPILRGMPLPFLIHRI